MNFGIGTNKSQNYLKNIKNKFTKEPVLKIYQSELPIRVKTDASDFAIKACLL